MSLPSQNAPVIQTGWRGTWLQERGARWTVCRLDLLLLPGQALRDGRHQAPAPPAARAVHIHWEARAVYSRATTVSDELGGLMLATRTKRVQRETKTTEADALLTTGCQELGRGEREHGHCPPRNKDASCPKRRIGRALVLKVSCKRPLVCGGYR